MLKTKHTISKEIEITNLDRIFSTAYQIMKKKDKEFFFSRPPEDLADEVITLIVRNKKKYPVWVLLKGNEYSLLRKIADYIREVKSRNQLLAFHVPEVTTRPEERIIRELKEKYPKAFIRKRKRTRKRYGYIQVKFEFTCDQAKLLINNPHLQNLLEILDGDNPLMNI